jgi:hypothetical protein
MRKKIIIWLLVFLWFVYGSLFGVSISVSSVFENENIYDPVKIIKSGEHIYLLDKGDQSLKILSVDRSLIRTIGRRGEGPAEFKSAGDFCLHGDRIFILDSNKIEVFSKNDGSHLATKRLKTSGAIKFCSDGETFYFLSLAVHVGGKLIKKYINKGELELVTSFLDATPVETGNLIGIYKNFGSPAYQNGKFYFAVMLSNNVLEFSGDGELLNRLNVPIRPTAFKDLTIVERENRMVLKLDRGALRELRQEKNTLYLLSHDEKGDSVIFKLENGLFKEMYRMKEKIISFDISGDEIWTIGRTDDIHVFVYKIK